jgi:hypothetical protein
VYLEVVGKKFLRLYGYLHDILDIILWSTVGKNVGKRTKQIDRSVKLIIESCLAELRKSNKKYRRHGECYF